LLGGAISYLAKVPTAALAKIGVRSRADIDAVKRRRYHDAHRTRFSRNEFDRPLDTSRRRAIISD